MPRKVIDTRRQKPRLLVTSQFPARVRKPTPEEMAEHAAALVARGMEDDGGRVVPVLISTDLRARDGHIIENWDTEQFTEQNPVVLWGHQRDIPAIGRAPIVRWDGNLGELRALAQFPVKEMNPFAWQIGEMVGRGYLHQPSVGWNTISASPEENPEVLKVFPFAMRIHLAELLEFSVVNVEADTATGFGRAVQEARANGMELEALAAWATQALDEGRDLFIPRDLLEDIALTDKAPAKRYTPSTNEPEPQADDEEIDMDKKQIRALIREEFKAILDAKKPQRTDGEDEEIRPDLTPSEKEKLIDEYFEETSPAAMATALQEILALVQTVANNTTAPAEPPAEEMPPAPEDEGTAAEGEDMPPEEDLPPEGEATDGEEDDETRAYWQNFAQTLN